ncbi:alpha-E domain-containing protein [Pseudoalteromonas sp. NEC-BIFX-2020_002]|uniref:alpha-E domain-containing protein n=1 Tax=Pseudoalteromonas sp. NEC-BIFX-2020_002 TaxID=2732353 RepID=UPI001476CA82|nr:alpha-E domain-containing protein [Pseudoalteromonas sp. NEC-BIFX-2020_002]NNG43050.1 alpha-E domain-containing protein [Pseudoalteromonas sp. NEC-BIFX-2020_002]
MLSRVGETLYWVSRYIERAENIARLINVNNLLMMDLPKGVCTGWQPLIDIIGVRKNYQENHTDFSDQHALKYLLVGRDNSSSILNSISSARESARTIRDVMPRDVWEAINSLYYYVKDNQNEGLTKRGRFNYLKEIIEAAHQIFGALDATINHDQGYIFIRFGSLIERADMTSRILDIRSATLITNEEEVKPYENIQWISLLRSLSAYQMYRQEMSVRVQRSDVIEFVMLSKVFPRSILFCMNELKTLIQQLPNSADIIKSIDKATGELASDDVRALKNGLLHDFIDEIQINLADIHNGLAETYFLK